MIRRNGGSRCFSLFFRKFTASEISSAAEILASRAIEARNNSKAPAVLSLFLAVFGFVNNPRRCS
jgi:hypothetical protein